MLDVMYRRGLRHFAVFATLLAQIPVPPQNLRALVLPPSAFIVPAHFYHAPDFEQDKRQRFRAALVEKDKVLERRSLHEQP